MTVSLRCVTLSCVLALAVAGCNKKAQEQPKPPPPEVVVMTATAQTVPLQRDLVGRLSPVRTADVRARVPGVLLKRVYQEGSNVKQGQVLFQIDPAPLQAALSAAQANLAAAQATYANAQASANRARQLAPQKFVSQSDLDNALAAERSAAASVQQMRANVQTARINLGYASITAPISGRAGKQQVTEGALVGQGEATLLTTVDQLDSLYVNFSISNAELAALRSGAQGEGDIQLSGTGSAQVQVKLSDGTLYAQPGTLDFSGMTVDPATGSVSLRATLPNPEHRLLPGAFVTLRATLGQQSNAFLIPQQAIQRDAQGAYAMVVGKDGVVARKPVQADQAIGNRWLITDGLTTGDQVITEGLQKVQEGAPAKPVSATAAPKPAANAPAKRS